MKVCINYRGVTLEYERRPLSGERFRTLCALGGCGLYVGLILGIAALCDLPGVLVAAAATVLIAVA